jgi:hypothetical protein
MQIVKRGYGLKTLTANALRNALKSLRLPEASGFARNKKALLPGKNYHYIFY